MIPSVKCMLSNHTLNCLCLGCGSYSRKCSFMMDWKPSRARPYPKQHHPVTTTLNQVSAGCLPETHNQCHSFLKVNSFTAVPPMQELISFPVGGATPSHCSHIHFTPSSPPIWLSRSHTHAYRLTFDLPRPGGVQRPFTPPAKHGLVKPLPIGGNKIFMGNHCKSMASYINIQVFKCT